MTPSVPQAVQSCHELLLWLIPQLDKFPRVRRFTLARIIHEHFCCNRRSAAMTGLRRAGSPLGPWLICLWRRAADVFVQDAGDQALIGQAFLGGSPLQHLKVGGR